MQSRDADKQALPPGSTAITMDESMRSCLLYFEDAVRSISKSPEEIFDEYGGHLGVSWEVRQDILAGKPLLEWDDLSIDKKVKIEALILAAERMPKSAWAGSGREELNDPAWAVLRKLASQFIDQS